MGLKTIKLENLLDAYEDSFRSYVSLRAIGSFLRLYGHQVTNAPRDP